MDENLTPSENFWLIIIIIRISINGIAALTRNNNFTQDLMLFHWMVTPLAERVEINCSASS